MAFCATCGAPVEGRFCAKCGSTVASGGVPAGAPQPAGQGQPAMATAVPMDENLASALCYITIVGIIFLLMAPYNQNRKVRFHAFQSIFLAVGCVIFEIGLSILSVILAFLHLGLLTLLFWPLGFVIFAFFIYMIIMTYQGKTIVLPVIGPLAQKQA